MSAIIFEGRRGRWTYDPDRKLGKGGLALVCEGEDADSGDPVAVKIIGKTTPTGNGLATRLRDREADIADLLIGQPVQNLIRTLDVAELGEDLLIVMDRAERSLRTTIEEEVLAPDSIVSVLIQIASGIGELHKKGILHRDLKPENILLHEGSWKISDFGIARDLTQETQTQTFVGWGSPGYMAPEQFRLEHAATPTDLYALGCIAYELLAGHRPFLGPDLSRQHQNDPIPPLPDGIPAPLNALVRQLLAKEANARPDARAVYERLTQIIEPPPVAALARIREQREQNAQSRAKQDAQEAAIQRIREAAARRENEAVARMSDVLKEATALLRTELPDLTLNEVRPIAWRMGSSEAHLAIELWPWDDAHKQQAEQWFTPGFGRGPRDKLRRFLVVGSIDGAGPRISEDDGPMANVVAELTDDASTFDWKLYRFRADAQARYTLGPTNRSHGFTRQTFSEQWNQIATPGITSVWALERQDLTANGIVELFAEAMAV